MKEICKKLQLGIGCMLAFGFCFFFKETVQAATTYEVTQQEEGLVLTSKGETLTNTYVALKNAKDAYSVVEPGSKGSKLYYFDENGIGATYSDSGFIKITYNGKKREYYSKKGTLQKNQIVGNKKQGYYYVDPTGVKVTDKTTKLAVKFVRDHTKSSDSQSEKLKKCYYYLAGNYKYKRYYTGLYPKAKNMQSLAYDMLSAKQGNCHRYAASFAYIAKVLGYDVKVVVGDISSSRGGMTPHGWTEVESNGTWYVCDPDMELNHVNSYWKKSTPCRTSVTRKCKMTVKNGKVTWK